MLLVRTLAQTPTKRQGSYLVEKEGRRACFWSPVESARHHAASVQPAKGKDSEANAGLDRLGLVAMVFQQSRKVVGDLSLIARESHRLLGIGDYFHLRRLRRRAGASRLGIVRWNRRRPGFGRWGLRG